jgi:anaerobic magnesium-protoporphyrin IX monomethyl ester cyclase
MRISLVIPPSPFLGDQKRNPPLGIMYVAAYIEQNNYDVKLTDLRDIEENNWINHIVEGDIYGITATTPEYPYAIKIAEQIKKRNSASFIVLGGVHATAVPYEINELFDCVVIGEGEYAMIDVIKDFENKVKKKYYSSGFIKDLDTLPFPARHLVQYDSVINKNLTIANTPATSIIASRGCPYNCAFCVSKLMWTRRVRFRSPNNVIEEIKKVMKDYGIRHFRFHDDTIAASKKWVTELCEKIKPLNIVWRASTRVDHSNLEILKMMKDSGCYEISYGIETISDEVLEINRKNVTIEQMYEAMDNAKAAGLYTRLFFMIGLPGQDADIANEMIKFIERTKPDAVDLSTFVPYPGSDIYNDPAKYGIEITNKDFSDYVFTRGLYGHEAEKSFIYKHDKLTEIQLIKLRKQLLRYILKYNLILNY